MEPDRTIPITATVDPEHIVVPVDTKVVPPTVARDAHMVASPTTTAEQDLVTKGQRLINGIWETTQAIIAVLITLAVIYCDIMQIKTENLGKAFVLIIAIYFVRMNHIKTGGIGGTDSR